MQEIYDVSNDKFGKRAEMITATDQCYLFKWLMPMIKCKKAIEVGVFTGSSALCIADGMDDDGKLIAIDVNEEFTSVAQEMWKKAGVDKKIEVKLNGGIDGLDDLISEKGTFDFAYIDAIKTEYIDYYEKLLLLLRKGGVMAFDNTLQRGLVAEDVLSTRLPERRKKIVNAMKEFNEFVRNDDRVEMCMLAMNDGVTLVRVL